MIIVSGMPVTEDLIRNEYSERGIQREILYILSTSYEKYYYDSLEQLKFESVLRQEIIEASKQLYKSRMAFEVFRKSRCNPDYWQRTAEGGFVLRNDVRPSDGIADIFVNGTQYATECATAMVMVYYKALLNVYPKVLFDNIFSNIYLMNWHSIDDLLEEIGEMNKTADFLPGDRRYFDNPDVDPLHAYMQGENAIDLGNGMYYGHGIGIHNANTMIRALNSYRKPDATVSAHLLDVVGRPNFKKLSDVYYQSF